MKRLLFTLLLIPCIFLFITTPAQAADIPEALQEWQDWVLNDEEAREFCPQLKIQKTDENRQARRICTWAGNLALNMTDQGASFRQDWNILAESWIPLPGDQSYWPRSVRSNGNAVEVVARNIDGQIRPVLLLDQGRYQISGEFTWESLPNSLSIPRRSALVDLSVNGQAVKEVYTESGDLWLGERQEKEKDKLFANVYRKFADGLPFEMDVVLLLSASGQSRELTVENLLPQNFVLMNIRSELAYKQAADGELTLQVHPGDWEVKLKARALSAPVQITAKPVRITSSNDSQTDALELKDEVWSYQDAPWLRNTQVQGLNLIDPNQSDVPGEWEQLPTFIARAGDSLDIIEKRRGIAASPNQLQLNRSLWLDFDNTGYTFRDRITGNIHSGWRLDLNTPFELQSASSGSEQSLVTKATAGDANGIEVRKQHIDITASGQLNKLSDIPVSAWSDKMQNVHLNLHVPPGYRLLAAPGSDTAHGSWLSKWQLWDIFFLLFVSVAFGKLVNSKWGLFSFVMLLLTYHEPNAPKWLWLNLALALTLVNISEKSRLANWTKAYQALSVILLVLVSIPFFGQQARTFIYPQLEPGLYSSTSRPFSIGVEDDMLQESADPYSKARSPRIEPMPEVVQEIVVTGSRMSNQNKIERYDPKALIQTGPGIPTWNWRSYQLNWSGPVDSQQSFKPVILGPWLSRLWLLAGVALILVLLARLAKQGYQDVRNTEFVQNLQNRTASPGTTQQGTTQQGSIRLHTLLIAALMGIMAMSTQIHADYPSSEMLQELKERLLKPAECQPSCTDLHLASLDVTDNEIQLTLEYHLLDKAAIALPGKRGQWLVENIRDANGQNLPSYTTDRTWVLLDQGIQKITLSSNLAQSDAAQIQFTQRPRHVDVRSKQWDVNGVKNGILLSDSIQLLRRTSSSNSFDDKNATRVQPFVLVERELLFGLDWLVETTVRRMAPEHDNLQIRIPLLPNESVLSDNIEQEANEIIVSLNTNQNSFSWQSQLPRTDTLELEVPASAKGKWQEQWGLTMGHLWNVETSGTPEIRFNTGTQERHPVYRPRVGETLLINVSRPEATHGATLAIENVHNSMQVGKRLTQNTLQFTYRSSQGGQHLIQFPANAELRRVLIDGRENFVQLENQNLSLSLLPGQHHVEINWDESTAISQTHRNSALNLNHAASNVRTNIRIPRDRWLLFASSEKLGPAILYWPRIVVLLLLAIALGKFAKTPLRWYDWVFLGLGFSTISWFSYLVFAAWLLAFAYRNRYLKDSARGVYNFSQIILAGLTFAAGIALLYSLPTGLLGRPNMSVRGFDSSAFNLNWYHDKVTEVLPQVSAISVPMWIYKLIILIWALWLSFALIKWIPLAWKQFSERAVWIKSEKSKPTPPQAPKPSMDIDAVK